MNRIASFSVKQPVIFFRTVQTNRKKVAEISMYEAPRLENDSVHKTLEDLPAYQNHVLPSPKSCKILIHFKYSDSTNKNCNCLEKCILSKQIISRFVESKPKIVINMTELFARNLSYSTDKNNLNIPRTSQRDAVLDFFKWQDIEKLLKSGSIDRTSDLGVILQSASDFELTEIMINASLWHCKQEYNFSLLIAALDKECCKRYLNWSVEHQLRVADIWYHLNMGRICKYSSKMIKKIAENFKCLTKCQLIHLLFIINLRRKADLELMLALEKLIENKVESFLIEEIVVIAMAYFKTSTRISSSVIISTMVHHLKKSLLDMKSLDIICVVKSLRYSFHRENKHLIEELLKKATENHIWKEYFPLAAHLCLLAHRYDLYVPELLDSVTTDMFEFENVRLKDIAKVLSTLSKFNHPSPRTRQRILEFCQNEFNHLKRQDEINMHCQMYVSSLLNLSYMGIFIHEELNKAFNYKSTNLADELSRDLATLDCITEIDQPQYTGNHLDMNERFVILQRHHLHYPTSHTRKLFLECITLDLQTLLQGRFSTKTPLLHILPYMADPVFLLIFDENGQLCKLPENFLNHISKGHIAKPTDKNNWVVIWLLSKKEMYSSQEFVGLSLVKERHFIKLGFKLIKVPSDVCINFNKSKRFLQASLKCFLPES